VVDAVHYAPHGPIDVRALGCDLLVFAGYKVFGPMSGVLWVGGPGSRRCILPCRAERRQAPCKFEQGTPTTPSDGRGGGDRYLAWLGGEVEAAAADVRRSCRLCDPCATPDTGRAPAAQVGDACHRRMGAAAVGEVIAGWQRELAPLGVRLHGVADPVAWRSASDIPLRDTGKTQEDVKRALWRRSRIEVPSGNYYALAVYRQLRSRRTVRASFAHYDTPATARLLVRALRGVARGARRRGAVQRGAGARRGRPRPVAR